MTTEHTSPAVEIRKTKIVYSVLQVARTESVLLTVDLCGYFLCRSFPSRFPPPPISFFLLTSFGVTISPRTPLQNTPDTFFSERNVFLKLYIFFAFLFLPALVLQGVASLQKQTEQTQRLEYLLCVIMGFFSLLHRHRSPFSPSNRGLGFSDTLSLCI